MPSVLILDDSPNRLRLFGRALHGVAIAHAFDRAGDAIDYLRENAPAVAFLDHDLDEYGASRAEAGTGMDVVDYLCLHADRLVRPLAVVVHSLNPIQAPLMLSRLRTAGYRCCRCTFAWEHPEAVAAAVTGSLFHQPKKTVS